MSIPNNKPQNPDAVPDPADIVNLRLLENHVHYLSGEIENENIRDAIKWILFENLQPKKPPYLTLYVNTAGGMLYQAIALIDVMRNSKIPVRTIGLGTVCSAGFLIFSSGARGHRIIYKNTEIMCHQYSDAIEGKHHDLKSTFKELELSSDRMIRILSENTGLDARTVKRKLLPESDVWMTAEELVEYGVADKVG